MIDVVVGLGANLGEPPVAFAAALRGLEDRSGSILVSRRWKTRPVGPDQPDFTNAAALVSWAGSPSELLARCRELESLAGRNRASEDRWGPRTLDLDILMTRDLVWRGPKLELPHPHFHERAFALVPAAELVPDWVHPLVGRTIAELASELERQDPDALISSEEWEPGV
jgi:2-amino-4-hydroxy-6-hydroxymethyldihydropteridine diphosphokinase